MRNPFFIYCFRFLLLAAAAAAVLTASKANVANAAGFGVSPSNIDFIVEKGSSASRQLIIYSTGADAKFVAASENPELAVLPSAGALGEGESAAITVTATGKKIGKSDGEILISLSHDSGNAGNGVLFSLGTRVGVSLAVVESAMPSANFFVGMLTSAGVVMVGLSAYLALRRKSAQLLPARA